MDMWTSVCCLVIAVVARTTMPQEVERVVPDDDLVVVTGSVAVDSDRRLPLDALDLGNGGFVEGTVRRAPRSVRGTADWTSPGGALVRVADAGVKLDLPSGAELMIDLQCRIHLRSGAATLPALHGVDLLLADGSRIVVRPSSSNGRHPLRSVIVDDGEQATSLWLSRRATRNAATRRDAVTSSAGLAYCVLGDGDVLYETRRRGPIVFCERVLCDPASAERYPRSKVVVLGDSLAESLTRLPDAMPATSDDYPEGPRVANYLAHRADVLFRDGVQRRPSGAVGAPVVPLADGLSLGLVRRPGPSDVLVLELRAPRAAEPLVEWVIGDRATLHLVRQDSADQPARSRYYQRGIALESDGRAPRSRAETTRR